MTKTICLALTGASGMPYGLRLLECLLAAGCHVQLLYSQAAQVVARQEMDFELPSRPAEARAALLARAWLIPHNGVFLLTPVFAAAALVFGTINGLIAAKLLADTPAAEPDR